MPIRIAFAAAIIASLGCGAGFAQDIKTLRIGDRLVLSDENGKREYDYGDVRDAFARGDFAAAVPTLLAFASSGDAAAMHTLGTMYLEGKGVAPSPAEAVRWLQEAGRLNHAPSQYMLGLLLYYGQGVQQNLKLAHDFFLKAANNGHAKSQFTVATMYQLGQGVARDMKAAIKYHEQAAAQGIADSTAALADIYLKGDGVPRDPKRGEFLLREAAEMGHQPSKQRYAAIRDDRHTKDLAAARTAERRGDFATSREILERLTREQSIPAYVRLAEMYVAGRGVTPSRASAITYYRGAARLGHAESQLRLGYLLAGVDAGGGNLSRSKASNSDLTKAYMWMMLSAEGGNARARKGAVTLKRRLSATARDRAERAANRMKQNYR